MRRRSAAILPSRARGGLAPQPARALAVARPGAGEPRHPALSSPAARGVPGARGARAADLEPVAERRPAAALEPQLRGVLSAELAGLRGAPGTTRSACWRSCTRRSPSRAPGGWRGTSAAAAGRRRSRRWGTSGCGAYLSLLSAYTLFCSMAWFPWVLAVGGRRRCGRAAGRALVAAGAPGRRRPRPPAPQRRAVDGGDERPRRAGPGRLGGRPAPGGGAARPPVPVLFAVALAAVQLLPTLGRLADSPRKELPTWPRHALVDAARAAGRDRLPALLRRSGAQPARGVYFGWKLEDRDYPYVESIYPGLLLAVLGRRR